MHHGMGVSAGDRRCVQNMAMQPRNGVCDKIENYISELGQWYVSKGGLAGAKDFSRQTVDPPSYRLRGGKSEGVREGSGDKSGRCSQRIRVPLPRTETMLVIR